MLHQYSYTVTSKFHESVLEYWTLNGGLFPFVGRDSSSSIRKMSETEGERQKETGERGQQKLKNGSYFAG